jgi:hypothetical protein
MSTASTDDGHREADVPDAARAARAAIAIRAFTEAAFGVAMADLDDAQRNSVLAELLLDLRAWADALGIDFDHS